MIIFTGLKFIHILAMALPKSTVSRTLKHTRSIKIEFFWREDELWDIEARLTDVKTHSVPTKARLIEPFEPIHNLCLRLTVDQEGQILDAIASSDNVPFSGYCETIHPNYKKMIGLNVTKGFRQGIRERFPNAERCTHLNELGAMIPTAAIQTLNFSDVSKKRREIGGNSDQKPFELENCHALQMDAPAVAVFYPKWFTGKPQN